MNKKNNKKLKKQNKKEELKPLVKTYSKPLSINVFSLYILLILLLITGIFIAVNYILDLKDEADRQLNPICAGKTIEEAIILNECPLYKLMYTTQHPEVDPDDIKCICPYS